MTIQCKNHINLHDGLPDITNSNGFGGYASFFLIIHFPRLIRNFFHQVVCVDNPAWEEISNKNYKPYNPNWYAEHLKEVAQNVKQVNLLITKIETLK